MDKKERIRQYKATPAKYGVIQIKNTKNGKTFIDTVANTHNRWGYYRLNLNKNFYRTSPLQADWNTFGESAFTYEVLWEEETTEVTNLRQTLKDLKQTWLAKCQPAYNQK